MATGGCPSRAWGYVLPTYCTGILHDAEAAASRSNGYPSPGLFAHARRFARHDPRGKLRDDVDLRCV